MPPPNQPVDKDGFPIPSTFEAVAQKKAPQGGQAVWLVRTLLLLGGVALLVGLVFKSIGPSTIANWYQKRAIDRAQVDDFAGAVAELDHAIAWTPDELLLYYQRATYRYKANELTSSLEDYNHIIEINPNFASAYTGRSMVYQRLDRHREAIDDLTHAIQLRPKNDHTLLNNRAYARAIGKMELEEGLVDVQQAIDLVGEDEPLYLDTRGYLYYLLDRQEEALKDLDRAVQLTSMERKRSLQAAGGQRSRNRRFARSEREWNEIEGVMIYHRGLIHEKLGHAEQARSDKERGEQLGYNPAAGVF